jgi:hypothetical protein
MAMDTDHWGLLGTSRWVQRGEPRGFSDNFFEADEEWDRAVAVEPVEGQPVTGYYITSMLRATVPEVFQVYGRQGYIKRMSSISRDSTFARARGRVRARTVIG